MFRLFLEGVYNNGEVMWLELKWLFYSLLRSRIYSKMLSDLDWVEVMPSKGLVRFCDWRGSLIWRYKIVNGNVVPYKGWEDRFELEPNCWNDSYSFMKEVTDSYFYEKLDRILR